MSRVDVKHTLRIEALDASIGRVARVRRRTGPRSTILAGPHQTGPRSSDGSFRPPRRFRAQPKFQQDGVTTPRGIGRMNDKNDLLVTEAMDLVSRAEGLVALAYAERPGEAWTLPLEVALKHLSGARKQLEVLSVDDPKLRATAS